MKKFLALMFVCAGLTAMAAPHVNKADLVKANVGQKVMKANTLSNQLTAPMMTQSKGTLTPRQFMKDNKVNFNDNRLSRKAPRRMSDADVVANKYIDMRYIYSVDTAGQVVEDPWHYRGGQGVQFRNDLNGDQLYCAGIYWNMNTGSSYYLPLYIDYDAHTVELPAIGLLDDDTITGTAVSNTRVDTVDFSYLVDWKWYTGQNQEMSSTYGTIYDDGTIEFNDSLPFVFEGYRALLTYKKSGFGGAWTLQSSDTTFFSEIHVGTQFIVPNGNHEFGYIGSGTTERTINADVFMMQPNDTTVVVFNPWGFGYPNVVMYINSDGVMTFPGQYVYNDEEGDYFANGLFELDENNGFIFDDQGYVDGYLGFGTTGEVTPDAITWESTVMMTEAGSLMYPFLHNKLTFTNGSQFVIPGPAFVRGDANNDGEVTIDDVTFLIDALLSGDLDVLGEGADCDLTGEITIDDVTSLIDFLLSNEWK